MVGVTRRVNRIKSRAPKLGLYWCWKCDRCGQAIRNAIVLTGKVCQEAGDIQSPTYK